MAVFAIAVWSAGSIPVAHGGKFRSALADRDKGPIEGHRPCEAQTVAAGGRRIRALCPRHVRAPTGGRCQGATYTYVGARGRALLRRGLLSGEA